MSHVWRAHPERIYSESGQTPRPHGPSLVDVRVWPSAAEQSDGWQRRVQKETGGQDIIYHNITDHRIVHQDISGLTSNNNLSP